MHWCLAVFVNTCVGLDTAQTALRPEDVDGIIPVQDMISVSSMLIVHIVVVALCRLVSHSAITVCCCMQECFLSQHGIDPDILDTINSLPEDSTIHVSVIQTTRLCV